MAVPGKPLSQNPRDHRPPPQQESLISPPREVWRTVPQVTTTANIMHLGTIQLPSPERAGGLFSSVLSSCSCHYHCLVVLFREGGLFSSESLPQMLGEILHSGTWTCLPSLSYSGKWEHDWGLSQSCPFLEADMACDQAKDGQTLGVPESTNTQWVRGRPPHTYPERQGHQSPFREVPWGPGGSSSWDLIPKKKCTMFVSSHIKRKEHGQLLFRYQWSVLMGMNVLTAHGSPAWKGYWASGCGGWASPTPSFQWVLESNGASAHLGGGRRRYVSAASGQPSQVRWHGEEADHMVIMDKASQPQPLSHSWFQGELTGRIQYSVQMGSVMFAIKSASGHAEHHFRGNGVVWDPEIQSPPWVSGSVKHALEKCEAKDLRLAGTSHRSRIYCPWTIPRMSLASSWLQHPLLTDSSGSFERWSSSTRQDVQDDLWQIEQIHHIGPLNSWGWRNDVFSKVSITSRKSSQGVGSPGVKKAGEMLCGPTALQVSCRGVHANGVPWTQNTLLGITCHL